MNALEQQYQNYVVEVNRIKHEFENNTNFQTGFTETLGPAKIDPAANEILPYWQNEIKQMVEDANRFLKNIIEHEQYYQPVGPIYSRDEIIILENYPEYYEIQLNNGVIEIPTLDKSRVRELLGNNDQTNDIIEVLVKRRNQLIAIKNNLNTIEGDPTQPVPQFDPTLPPNQYIENLNKLKLLDAMVEYPQNSNLENYILINHIVGSTTIDRIWIRMIRQLDTVTTNANILNSTEYTRFATNGTIFTNSILKQINKRNFISLIILIFRNAKNSFMSSSSSMFKSYYDNLFNEFNNANTIVTISDIVEQLFTTFFNNVVLFNFAFIQKILNGEYIYNIYINNYENPRLLKDVATEDDVNKTKRINQQAKEELDINKQILLTKEVIKKRIGDWVTKNIYLTDTLPVSYILNRYTEEQKKIMMKEKKVCEEIAELTGKLGRIPYPSKLLSDDFFVKEDISKINAFNLLEETGPNMVKSNQLNRRRNLFEGRNYNGGNNKTLNSNKKMMMNKKNKTRKQ